MTILTILSIWLSGINDIYMYAMISLIHLPNSFHLINLKPIKILTTHSPFLLSLATIILPSDSILCLYDFKYSEHLM